MRKLPYSALFCTSQTKPGPNMTSAVARNVSRSVSVDEKSLLICIWKLVDGRDSTPGFVLRPWKKKWLLKAMLAMLKAYALVGSRAKSMTSDFAVWFSYGVSGTAVLASAASSSVNGRFRTGGRRIQFVDHVLLVIGIGYLEGLLGKQLRHAIALQLSMVFKRGDGVEAAGER